MAPLQNPHPPLATSVRRSPSPYQRQPEVHLREDSEGNISGVEYIAGSSGNDSEDDYRPQGLRKGSHSSASCRTLRPRNKTLNLRGSSQTITQRPLNHGGVRRGSNQSATSIGIATQSSDPHSLVSLCPSPGRRPSASFTLSSPETSGKDDSTDDDDIPALSLPQPSIRKSPLLHRDLWRFVTDSEAGGKGGEELDLDLDLEPMIFAMSLSEDEDYGYLRRGRQRANGASGSNSRQAGDVSCSPKGTPRNGGSGEDEA